MTILISNEAAKTLEKVHGPELERLKLAIDNLQISPGGRENRLLMPGSVLGTADRPLYEMQVGAKWRLLYSIDPESKTIILLTISKHEAAHA